MASRRINLIPTYKLHQSEGIPKIIESDSTAKRMTFSRRLPRQEVSTDKPVHRNSNNFRSAIRNPPEQRTTAKIGQVPSMQLMELSAPLRTDCAKAEFQNRWIIKTGARVAVDEITDAQGQDDVAPDAAIELGIDVIVRGDGGRAVLAAIDFQRFLALADGNAPRRGDEPLAHVVTEDAAGAIELAVVLDGLHQHHLLGIAGQGGAAAQSEQQHPASKGGKGSRQRHTHG